MSQICAVINLRREGLRAHASVTSALRAAEEARLNGISVELLVVAARSDEHTENYARSLADLGSRVLTVDVDDLWAARDAAIQNTSSDYIAFLNGDDLWTRNWLRAAYACATSEERPVVWHPEGSLVFGEDVEPYWLMHPDMDDDAYLWIRLALSNLWTSLAFASRELFASIPYTNIHPQEEFGRQDWLWNAEAVARGAIHKVVPGLSHLIRATPPSIASGTQSSSAIIAPSNLFRSAG